MADVKCDKCDREFKEEEAHEHTNNVRMHNGKAVCEDCLVDMGVSIDNAQSYWSYVRSRTDIANG